MSGGQCTYLSKIILLSGCEHRKSLLYKVSSSMYSPIMYVLTTVYIILFFA